MHPSTKVCTCCSVEKPTTEFNRCKRRGLKYFCRDCSSQKSKLYYYSDLEKSRDNKRERAKVAREADRDGHRKQRRDWAKANRPKVSARKRVWRLNNIDECRRKEYAYIKRRESSDIKFKLSNRISALMRLTLGGAKGDKWESIVGYSASDLKTHLERQFSSGMTWKNYGRGHGRWQIDHIIPIAEFTFSSAADEGFPACWAMTNLRPLWAIENMAKSDNRTLLI
jgi:hypothetical protein